MLEARGEGGAAQLAWRPLASRIGNFGPDPTFLLSAGPGPRASEPREPNSNNPEQREHNAGPGSLLATHPLGVWLLPHLSAPSHTPTLRLRCPQNTQTHRAGAVGVFYFVPSPRSRPKPGGHQLLGDEPILAPGSWVAPGGILFADVGAAVAPSPTDS